ncbi:RNA polymerase sigma factor [Aquihabitans daechungensis]|uniref:RNA polymerase sigma factor n=1 Tax=Aquihabitans daechungensis TaxID=1052257 RepID=UPI003B9F5FF2
MTDPAAGTRPQGWAPEDVALYAAQAPRLLALAAALAGPSNAEDIVSAAVLRSFTTPGWPQVTSPSAYLTRAVVNEVRAGHRSALRRAAREARYLRRADPAPDLPDSDPELLAALARLPLQQRAVTFLTYWGDLTPAAVAAELGLSEGSVRKYLSRARSTLRKGLQ